jgi:hypothetical protein
MKTTHVQEETLQLYGYRLVERLEFVRILEGATKKKRAFSHIFVPGALYGGHLGKMLCYTGWKNKVVYGASEIKLDLCPICQKRLRALTIILTNLRARDLFLVSGGAEVTGFGDKEIKLALREMWQQERKQITKAAPLSLFEESALKQPIRRTALCQVPAPRP